jgi:hypothetical protein
MLRMFVVVVVAAAGAFPPSLPGDVAVPPNGKDEPKQLPKAPAKEREPVGVQLPEHLPKSTDGDHYMAVLGFGIAILVFGLASGGAAVWLVKEKHISETSSVRIISLVFLATIAALLIVGGYSQVQISSAMTLLGTLAGYIFGRSAESGFASALQKAAAKMKEEKDMAEARAALMQMAGQLSPTKPDAPVPPGS